MSNTTLASTYRPEIDGLRAVAVLPVILFHGGIPYFGGGFVGVDIFFVISGYLITTIILTEQSCGRFSIAGFYERRARRILPALFFVMAACLPFAWHWMPPAELEDFGKSILAVTVFSSNFYFWKTSGYFDFASEEKPLLHTWSLGVEEQYYMVFPLFILATWRLGRRRQACLVLCLLIASLIASEWGWRNHPMANFFLPPTRAWELLIGSLLALLSFQHPIHSVFSRKQAQFISAVGLAFIAFSIFFFDKSTPFPSLYALVPTLGTAMVLGAGNGDTYVGRLLSSRHIVGVGLISYSAYLWHQPLFAFARIQGATRPSEWTFLLLGCIALLLAYISWRYVEIPFRNRRATSRQSIALASTAGTLLFMVLAAGSIATQGFPERLPPSVLAQLETTTSSPLRAQCHTGGHDFMPPERACIYFHPNATWATFGDSHTVELAYALGEVLKSRGEGLLHLSFSGCPPALLFESAEPGCSNWIKQALSRLENDSNIKNVIVGFRYSVYLFGDQLDGYPKLPEKFLRINGASPESSRELFWNSFEEIVKRLERAGKIVYVLAPVPELGRSVRKEILSGYFKRDLEFEAGTTRAYYEKRHQFILDRLEDLKTRSSVEIINPSSVLCDKRFCRALLEGEAMYFDDNHLSLTGARKVIEQLRPHVDLVSGELLLHLNSQAILE